MTEKKTKEVELEVQLEEQVAQGIYSNLVAVNHSETEFVVDFIFVQPQAPKAKVRSRIVLSPKHAKRFVMAMQENINRFENNFGAIEPTKKTDDDASERVH